jgi:hypothetical protein
MFVSCDSTCRVPLVEQEMLAAHGHMISPLVCIGFHVAQSLVFCVFITRLVSSNFLFVTLYSCLELKCIQF